MVIHTKLLSNWFVGTGPAPSPNGLFCASILLGTITDVYSTSTRAEGPIPENPSLVTLTANSLPNPTAWADIVQVRWQATDTQILAIISSEISPSRSSQASTSAQSSGASSSVTSSSVTSSTGKESLPAHSGISSSTLSTGAKAGIGVGVAIVVLAVVSGFLLICWKRRRDNALNNGARMHELDRQHNGQPLKGELDGQPIIEVADTQKVAAELPT